MGSFQIMRNARYSKKGLFFEYGLLHKELIDEVAQVTYKPFGYQKGKGVHKGWYFDVQKTALIGNQIDGMYQSKKRSLQSKDCKQRLAYLRAVDEYLTKHNIYKRIKKLMKSRSKNHKEAEPIDEAITQATKYSEQQCKIRQKGY